MSTGRDDVVRPYDALQYASLAHRQTDPDRLATVARIHGINTPPVARCRVLELGCAVGGNLAAMAMTLPNAQFVGVDLSERQIAHGRAAIAAAGIGNVALCALDLMDVGTSLGTFDYIIAHGVFSWVSRDAQDEILSIFGRCLAPNGIAYVSYNTRPGWHELSVIRDALMFDGREIVDPRDRVKRARDYLAWLSGSIPDGGAHGRRFIEEVAMVGALDDSYLLHEYLGPFHMPIHIHKVVARAARCGLWYLCDAEPALSADHSRAPEAERARERSPNELVWAEQHYDFLANRRFRRSLFCRRGSPLTRTMDPRHIDALFVSSRGQPVGAGADVAFADLRGPEEMTFRAPEADLTSAHPVMKAALVHLASVSPRAIPFGELLEAVRARLGPSPDQEREADELRGNLMEAFLSSTGVVALRTHAPPCVTDPGERPVASAWARHLAAETNRVASLDHDMVLLDDVVRRLLPLLDGTRDRAALERELSAMFERGEIVIRLPDGRAGKPAPGAMDSALRSLARSALLIG